MRQNYFVVAYTKGDSWTAQAPVWKGRVSRPRYALRHARKALREHVLHGGGTFPRDTACVLTGVGVYSYTDCAWRPTKRLRVDYDRPR